jgi:hypothetical protein
MKNEKKKRLNCYFIIFLEENYEKLITLLPK